MQGGKVMISRGHESTGEVVPITSSLRASPPASVEPESEPARIAPRDAFSPAPDIQLVDYRIQALERLARLRDKGALDPDEYLAEKCLVLRLPAGEGEVSLTPSRRAKPGPSLVGRLFSWKLVALGAASGIAFIAATAPSDLVRLYETLLRIAA